MMTRGTRTQVRHQRQPNSGPAQVWYRPTFGGFTGGFRWGFWNVGGFGRFVADFSFLLLPAEPPGIFPAVTRDRVIPRSLDAWTRAGPQSQHVMGNTRFAVHPPEGAAQRYLGMGRRAAGRQHGMSPESPIGGIERLIPGLFQFMIVGDPSPDAWSRVHRYASWMHQASVDTWTFLGEET